MVTFAPKAFRGGVVGYRTSYIICIGCFLKVFDILLERVSQRSSREFEEALSETGLQCDVPASASEVDGPSDAFVPSDEEPTSGGLWSATGTGTEEDTGGDYTEGDGEVCVLG